MPNSFTTSSTMTVGNGYTKRKFSEVLKQAIQEFELRGGTIRKIDIKGDPFGLNPVRRMSGIGMNGRIGVSHEY